MFLITVHVLLTLAAARCYIFAEGVSLASMLAAHRAAHHVISGLLCDLRGVSSM